MWVWGLLLTILLGGWGILYAKSQGKYVNYTMLQMDGVRLTAIASPMLYVQDQARVSQRFPIAFYKVQRLVQKISGDRRIGEQVSLFIAEMMSYVWLLLSIGCGLSLLMGGDSTGFILGAMLAVLLPFALVNDLYRKVQRREQEIIMELPELLGKIILLVGAGETVQQAIRHCLQRKQGQESHPLYRELFQMMRELESGYSFQQALEAFSKRCGIQEVSAFTTAILLNFRRGGNDFVLSLRDLSATLWDKRKAVSRTKGEQASSKLLFPMLLLFIVVLILVGTPAFIAMGL